MPPPPPGYSRQQSDWSSRSGQTSGSTPQYGLPAGSDNRAKRTVTIKQQPAPHRDMNGHSAAMGTSSAYANGNASRPNGGGIAGTVKRNLTRAKTLTRPDRHVTPAPLINAHQSSGANSAVSGVLSSNSKQSWFQPWSLYISIITFWAPSAILSACGMKEPAKQRAWKEKVALCSLCMILGGFVGFATIGLNRTLCPADQGSTPNEFIRLGEQPGERREEL